MTPPTTSPAALSNPRLGAICAFGAVVFFSTIDSGVKFLSDAYALHQVVLIRSLVAMSITLVVLTPLLGGYHMLRTRRLGLHLCRGMCVVLANMTFFLGLAAMPLAEGVAIFFVSPLLITAFSVIFLGEHVGPRRWAAVGVGLLGVVVILRPGTSAFQPASILPLIAAFGYAGLHMLTRVIGRTENAVNMSFYIQVTFIGVCLAMGLVVGHGRFDVFADPSLQFLLRAWSRPEIGDAWIFVLIGIAAGFGGYLISQAYRVAEAAVVAPFEYVALPLSILWGWLFFDEWPDAVSFVGIALILGAGLFVIWREARAGATQAIPKARRS
ncbi:MAG: DMT family transporter [Shimia sp.]